tara:strand:+ start:591 stop:815 length:225 start_codon:yes stop_codon:yes gene_type:complete
MKRIEVKVKPGSRESKLTALEDGTWSARLKSAPVDGKANQELIALFAKQFSLNKAQVTIRSGTKSKLKLVQIEE